MSEYIPLLNNLNIIRKYIFTPDKFYFTFNNIKLCKFTKYLEILKYKNYNIKISKYIKNNNFSNLFLCKYTI